MTFIERMIFVCLWKARSRERGYKHFRETRKRPKRKREAHEEEQRSKGDVTERKERREGTRDH